MGLKDALLTKDFKEVVADYNRKMGTNFSPSEAYDILERAKKTNKNITLDKALANYR